MTRNPFVVFIFGIISIIGISYLMQCIQEYFACLGIAKCYAWGSFWGFLFLNTIAAVSLRVLYLFHIKKRTNKATHDLLKIIIISLWLLLTFAIFSKFSKATDSYLEVPNMSMNDYSLFLSQPRNIPFSNIKYGLNEWRRPDTGRFRNCYQISLLQLKDSSLQRIINLDLNIYRQSLFEYLQNKGINILKSGDPLCIYPNYSEEQNQIKGR